MRYLTGYATKAKDSLSFKMFEYRSDTATFQDQWLTTYRLLTKRAPLVPEMWIHLARKTVMFQTFQAEHLFPPVPSDKLKDPEQLTNDHQRLYLVYLAWQRAHLWPTTNSYLDFARLYRYDKKAKKQHGTKILVDCMVQRCSGRGAQAWKTCLTVRLTRSLTVCLTVCPTDSV
jgi:hypothetical protein